MTLLVLIGGARAGKSDLALELARRSGREVTFVATAEARDGEMAGRIARHRAERPESWTTVEEPLELGRAVSASGSERFVIVDCLTLWVANLLERGDGADDVLEAARAVAAAAAARPAPVVAVTNEVGLGVVPATSAGRAYRDLLGAVNRVFVGRARRAFLVVAGRALPLGSLELEL